MNNEKLDVYRDTIPTKVRAEIEGLRTDLAKATKANLSKRVIGELATVSAFAVASTTFVVSAGAEFYATVLIVGGLLGGIYGCIKLSK